MSDEEDLNEFIEQENSELTEKEKDTISKKILGLEENFIDIASKEKSYIKDIEFFNSNNGDNSNTIFYKIDTTQTTLGKTKLAEILTKPIDDINKLEDRKYMINELMKNGQELVKLKKDIKKISECENDILWFFKDTSEELDHLCNGLYFDKFWNRFVNDNNTFMNIYYYCLLLFFPLYGILMPIILFIIPYLALTYIKGIRIPFSVYWTILKTTFFGAGTNILKLVTKAYQVSNPGSIVSIVLKVFMDYGIASLLYYVFTVGSYFYGIYSTITTTLSYNKVINFFHGKLNSLSTGIKTIYEIYSSYNFFNNKDLELELNTLKLETDSCLNYLWLDTFNGEPGYLTNKGNILTTYWKIKNNLSCIKPYLKYLANLDVWTSIAYKGCSGSTHHISFASYIKNDKPLLEIEKLNNLLITTYNVLDTTNNIKIDDNNKNIIITGGNASGKSTFIKGIIQTLVLGQTICLVPASSCKFTPFKLINTYLNIPDCQGVESLFQAEMSRCQEQIKKLDELKENELAFSVMDEIFVSTNFYEGMSGAYAIARKMARYNNSSCIITTHFPKLSIACKKYASYKNYYFPVSHDEEGNIVKTYKIKEGNSKEHIAIEMLEGKGFDEDIIKDAKKMYSTLFKKNKKKKY